MLRNIFHSDMKSISAKDAIIMIKSNPDTVLLDVRTPEEYAEVRIPGSINLPLDRINGIDHVISNRDQTIIVYCRSGARASAAARFLSRMGYTNVYDLGGIIDWPYETLKG